MTSNCPKCRSGILEKAGVINLTPKMFNTTYPVQLDISSEKSSFYLNVYVCSKDPCGYTVLRASESFLSTLKKERYKHYQIELQNGQESKFHS